MGFEMTYQAIPAGCGLIEMIRANPELGEDSSMVPSWFSRAKHRRPGPGRETDQEGLMWVRCCELAGRHPELFERHCDLDRWWDKLHYLLSATRRGEPASDSDRAVDRAFDAGELVSDQARAGQGAPVRYLPSKAVQKVAEIVGPRDHLALATHFRPDRMDAKHVYKFLRRAGRHPRVAVDRPLLRRVPRFHPRRRRCGG